MQQVTTKIVIKICFTESCNLAVFLLLIFSVYTWKLIISNKHGNWTDLTWKTYEFSMDKNRIIIFHNMMAIKTSVSNCSSNYLFHMKMLPTSRYFLTLSWVKTPNNLRERLVKVSTANDHLIEFHLIEIAIFHLIEITVITWSNYFTLFTWSKVKIMNSVKCLNLGVWSNYSIKCKKRTYGYWQLIESFL